MSRVYEPLGDGGTAAIPEHQPGVLPEDEDDECVEAKLRTQECGDIRGELTANFLGVLSVHLEAEIVCVRLQGIIWISEWIVAL